MGEKNLLLLVGLPRSGKTTCAKNLAKRENGAIVNPDSIRLALHGQRFYGPAEGFVWATAYLMVDALFRAGHDIVIVDATNVTERRREEWRSKFKSLATINTLIIPTSPVECRRRAEQEGDTEIIPVIDRMAAEWDLPKPSGWE